MKKAAAAARQKMDDLSPDEREALRAAEAAVQAAESAAQEAAAVLKKAA